MKNKNFTSLFSEIALSNNFDSCFGGWLKESSECIVVLNLQKSNFGNYYELNIKIYIQGLFGFYSKNKSIVKKEVGDIFVRPPRDFQCFLDLDLEMEVEKRRDGIKLLFVNFIDRLATKALTRAGILELANRDEIFLTPAVDENLR